MFQGDDDGGHLHNIVGGLWMASLDFSNVTILFDDAPVPAGARIAFASPVGEYFDCFHGLDSG